MENQNKEEKRENSQEENQGKKRQKEKRSKGPLYAVLSACPYLFCVAGFVVSGSSLPDALYKSIGVYRMAVPSPTPNLLLEIARWMGVCVTAGVILKLVSSAWRGLRNLFHYLPGDSVAVYGPERERQEMLKKLDRRAIYSGKEIARAHRSILLWDEETNLRFYDQNRERFRGRPVYLKCDSLPVQSVSESGLILFCPEETAARQYWKDRSIMDLSLQKGHQLKVVFLGFGRLGEELISFGLQKNLFHPDQRIEYHIFGEGAVFLATHPQLASISDPVCFHREPWYENLSLIEEADRVIVLTQERQLALLQNLLLATVRPEIDVFLEASGVEMLAGAGRLKPFRWKKEAELPERIFSDELYELAKDINYGYVVRNLNPDGHCTPEARDEEWRKLDTFDRYSNISVADFKEVCEGLMRKLGGSEEERLELLAELEHERWCRYHFLNNWRYGVPESTDPERVVRKDKSRRIHRDLVPYDALTESDKDKDRQNIRALLAQKETTVKGQRRRDGGLA